MRRSAVALCAVLLTFGFTTPASAQAYLFGGGGYSVPASSFSDIADAGWMGTAGLLLPLGEGFLVGGQGYYGRNNHRTIDGARTDLMGAMGVAYRTFGAPDGPTPFATVGAGYLRAKFQYSGSSVADSGLAASAGIGLQVPLGSLRGFLSGAYTLGFGDLSDVRWMAVNVGIGIPLGGGM